MNPITNPNPRLSDCDARDRMIDIGRNEEKFNKKVNKRRLVQIN
jgi:hypothetical protein